MREFKIQISAGSRSEAVEKIQALIDKGRGQMLAVNVMTGEIDESGHFEISSKARGSSLSRFKGRITEEGGAFYLVGEVDMNPKRAVWLKASIGVSAVFAFVLLFSGQPFFMVLAPLFLIVGYMNYRIAQKGSYLMASLKRLIK